MAWGGFKQKQKEVIWTLLWVLLARLQPGKCVSGWTVWNMSFTCSSRSSTFLCHPSLAAIISSSFCWEIWVSAACLSASYSSVNSSFNKRTSSLQNDKVRGKKIYVFYLMLKDIWSHCMPPWIGLWFHCFFAQITIHNSCCNICYVSNTDECDPERCQENKLKQHTRKRNCFGRDMKDSFCTAEHLSISGPNHLPSCPSFASLRFWSTSLWPHAVAAGSRSPPLNLDITNNAKRLQTKHIIIKKIHHIHKTTFTGIPSCRHKFCQSSIHLLLV